jgi:hypothetical protein
VTALFGAVDHARLTALRRTHFPPERNHLDAHLTLFHHLPPSIADELKARLAEETRAPAPKAELKGIRNLGQGTAFAVESPTLEEIRDRLADTFAGLLTPQDAAGWRPHITIQNKVSADAARALQRALAPGFAPSPLSIAGLAAWWYRGGPWELLSRHSFRG